MMEFHVIIPARFNSMRLPGKVLLNIGSKPMLQHVYERALESGADSIVIAVDNDKVREVAESFGATVCMTSDAHQSGTERIAEAVNLLDYDENDIIVGLQADEPFMPATAIKQVAEDLAQYDNVKIASLYKTIDKVADLFNPNITKVILNHRKQAMYFSRAPIPWERDNFKAGAISVEKMQGVHHRHIGIYAYRASFLAQYVEMESCDAEVMESLEQLRVLWHGGRIHMSSVKQNIPSSIDTEEDLQAIRQHYKAS